MQIDRNVETMARMSFSVKDAGNREVRASMWSRSMPSIAPIRAERKACGWTSAFHCGLRSQFLQNPVDGFYEFYEPRNEDDDVSVATDTPSLEKEQRPYCRVLLKRRELYP